MGLVLLKSDINLARSVGSKGGNMLGKVVIGAGALVGAETAGTATPSITGKGPTT